MAEAWPKDLKPEGVAAYLRAHPEFFNDHADVLPGPARGAGVVDFQQALLSRLKTDSSRAQKVQRELIETVRANTSNQSRIHTAALVLLEAVGFEEAVAVIIQDFPTLLDIDTVALVIESTSKEIPFIPQAGLRFVRAGTVEKWLSGGDATLQDNITGNEEVFGPGAGLVKSQAFVRLEISEGTPAGVIAFGSRNPDLFQPQQGVDQIGFLAQVVERVLRIWLGD